MDVKALILTGESETIEFKESLALKDEIGEGVSALSNTSGGTILVGVNDRSEIVGVEIGKKTLEDLANYIKTNTDNHVFPKISLIEAEGKDVVVIEVKVSDEKPVFFKGKAYIRVGKSRHKLSASEIRKLAKESGKMVYWDEFICEEATLEDIDWSFVKNSFIPKYESVTKRKVTGSDRELLEALRCARKGKPTNAGILLFGLEPQKFFRNSYIALARYKGEKEGADRLDYKEITGKLMDQIDNCDAYIKEHIAVMSRIHPYRAEREDISEYPLFSIRELIINSVCHRDYSEQRTKVIVKIFDGRIEFYNPGGLVDEITPENITQKQFSRNPAISKVLSKIGYIEEMGEGWDKIVDEHRIHPLKPEMPVINTDKYTMTVTLFSTRKKFGENKAPELNDRQKAALEYVRVHGKITNRDYQKLCPNVSRETLRKDLNELIDKKIIAMKGVKKGVYYELG